MRNIQAFNRTWEVRTGDGGEMMYADPNVVKLSDGRIKLSIPPDGTSAGIVTTTALGFGTYEHLIRGRLDALHPHAIFSIWMHDDRPDRPPGVPFEFDAEYGCWADQNRDKCLLLSAPGMEPVKLPLRCFERHRISLIYKPDGVGVRCEGWWELNQKWMEYGSFWKPCTPVPGLRTKVALWQFPKERWYPVSRPVTSVYFEGFRLIP